MKFLKYFFAALTLAFAGSARASYSQNFDALTTGAAVSGWTNSAGSFVVLATGSVSSPKAFGVIAPTNGDIAMYTAGTDNTDHEIDFSQIVHLSSSLPSTLDPVLRGNSAGTTGYLVGMGWASSIATLYKFSGGSFTAIGSTSAIGSFVDGDVVRIKAKIVGTQVSFKVWKTSGSEPAFTSPGSWIDSTYSTGYAGLRYNQSFAGTGAADDVTIASAVTSTYFTLVGSTPLIPYSGSEYDSKNLAAPSVWRNTLCRVNTSTGKLTTSAVGGSVVTPKWLMQYSAFNTSSYTVGATTIGAGTWTLALAYSDLLAGPWTPLTANTTAFNGGNPVDYPQGADGSYLAADGGIIEFTAPTGTLAGVPLLYHVYSADTGILRLMTSPDGITWTRRGNLTYNVLSGKTYGNVALDPQIRLLPDNTIELVGYNYTGSYDSDNYMCRATSTDCLTFTQTHEWFTETPPDFTNHLGAAAMVNVSGMRIMTFDACNVGTYTSAQRRIALAVFNPDLSVFGLNTTALTYGAHAWMAQTVFDGYSIYDADEAPTTHYLFFAGASGTGSVDTMFSQIGLATAPVVKEVVTTTTSSATATAY